MSNLRPQNTWVAMAHSKESAYATAITEGSIDKRYDLVEVSLAEYAKTRIDDSELIKGTEFPVDTANTGALTFNLTLAKDSTIPMVFPASFELLGLLFSLGLGTVSTSGAGPYVHTIVAQDPLTSALDQLPSTTIVQGIKGDTTTYYKYPGCVVNELRLAVDGRGRINVNVTFFGDGTQTQTSSFSIPSRSTQTPCFGKDATFKINSSGSSPATQSTLLRGFEITWNNNLSREDARGQIAQGATLTQMRFGTRSVSLNIKVQGNKGDAFWTDFLNETQKDIELAITSGTSSAVFNFDRCLLTGVKDGFDDIRNTMELTYTPFTKSITSYSPIEAVITNGIAAYLT